MQSTDFTIITDWKINWQTCKYNMGIEELNVQKWSAQPGMKFKVIDSGHFSGKNYYRKILLFLYQIYLVLPKIIV